MIRFVGLILVLLWLPAGAGRAATSAAIVPAEPYTALHRVAVPRATGAAVHEATGQLIVGHQPDDGGRQISVYALAAGDGKPAADPVRVALPAMPGTEAATVYPLALVVHPRLPLIYVVADAVVPAGDDGAAMRERIARLHVLLVRAGGLTLLRSHGAGMPMAWGQTLGLAAIDAGGQRLFLPHLQAAGPVPGFITLDARGMPRQTADGTLAIEMLDVRPPSGFGTGRGYVAGGTDAVVVAAPGGAMTWDLVNRRARLVHFPIPDAPAVMLAGGLAGDTAVYLAGHNSAFLARIDQAHGYLTLLPEIARIGGEPAPAFRGPPLPMAGADAVAVGSLDGLYVVGLGKNGRWAGTARFTHLPRSETRPLAWSPTHQQLYVITEP